MSAIRNQSVHFAHAAKCVIKLYWTESQSQLRCSLAGTPPLACGLRSPGKKTLPQMLFTAAVSMEKLMPQNQGKGRAPNSCTSAKFVHALVANV